MRYRTLALAAGLLILAACSESASPSRTPVTVKKAENAQANSCRSGWVVRTGENGQPDSTCADDQ